jgi:hypothetical protein
VFFHSEGRGLESLQVVAGTAIRATSALAELALVFVLVAIHALLKGERLLEITVAVASQAIHLLVLSGQGVFSLRMVETLA